MNVNYGLFPPLDPGEATFVARSGRRKKRPKREKNELLAARALEALRDYRSRVVEAP